MGEAGSVKWMFEQKLITYIPPRSTLNDYANNENTISIIEKLIQVSSLFFNDNEDKILILGENSR